MRTKRERNGQMQIGEMVMVIVVVLLLAVVGLVWYTKSSSTTTNRIADEDTQIALATTAHMVADMPELHDSLVGREDATIIDWERAKAFSQNIGSIDGRAIYQERFAGYSAEISCITPCGDGVGGQGHAFSTLTLFDYTGGRDLNKNVVPFRIPVLLRDPITRDSSFGVLTLWQVLP